MLYPNSGFRHDAAGAHFTGRTMVHGVIDAPEALADPSLARMVGEGTGSAFGRGYGTATSTSFWSISRVFVSPPPPHLCRGLCST